MRCLDGTASRYISSNQILRISIICKRLFSVNRNARACRQKEVLASNIDAQLFLYMSRHVWGVDEIRELVKKYHITRGRVKVFIDFFQFLGGFVPKYTGMTRFTVITHKLFKMF